nr:unnamed protein product [Callosobruchus chinensis]
MRVKYAAQIFSNSVASAVKSASQLQSIASDTAEETSNFINNIDRIFDSLNSKTFLDPNPNRRPLSKKSFNCKYLITSHLNQDPVENLFSVIRNRCGYNPTPSVRQFRISLQYNINIRLQKALDSGNCEEDPQELLDLNVSASEINQSPNVSNSTNPNENITSVIENTLTNKPESSCIHTIIDSDKVSLETCSNVYVAGYFARVLLKRYNCENNCEEFLLKDQTEMTDEKKFFY